MYVCVCEHGTAGPVDQKNKEERKMHATKYITKTQPRGKSSTDQGTYCTVRHGCNNISLGIFIHSAFVIRGMERVGEGKVEIDKCD